MNDSWLTGGVTCQEHWSFNGLGGVGVSLVILSLVPLSFQVWQDVQYKLHSVKAFFRSGAMVACCLSAEMNVPLSLMAQSQQAPCSRASATPRIQPPVVWLSPQLWRSGFHIEFWLMLIFCSVILGNFRFYYEVNLSGIVDSKAPLWVNILCIVPGSGKIQFQFMFLCRYEIW